jgi:hypothetical protein
MIGYNYLREGIISSQDNMASLVSFEMKSDFVKGFNAFAPGDSGQIAHTATSKASNLSSGIIRLSSLSAAIYA